MLGILLALTAALCWGTAAIFARLGLARIKPSMGTLISMLASLALVGSLALITRFNDVRYISLKALVLFGLIGVMNYFLGRQLNYSSIRRIGVTKATPLFATAPLFAIILAIIFLGENINIPIILGTLSVMAGLYLVISSK